MSDPYADPKVWQFESGKAHILRCTAYPACGSRAGKRVNPVATVTCHRCLNLFFSSHNWRERNNRRVELLRQKVHSGLSSNEAAELRYLQSKLSYLMAQVLPIADIDKHPVTGYS